MALADHPVENVLGPVADLLLDDASANTQGTCLDALERFGAVANLRDVRADGWFEHLGEQIANFQTVCEVMGDRFLAYSMILDIQIHSLATDPKLPANTTVEFSVADDSLQTLTLGEYRVRVVQAIMQQELPLPPTTLPLSPEAAVDLLGQPLVLLAPLFGLSLKQLVLASTDPDQPRVLVGFISEHGFSFMELQDFDTFVKQKVRRDLAGTQQEPFRLDLSVVEHARAAAARGDHDEVIAILESWPGLLVTLQRTPVLHQLDDAQLALIAEALEILGNAFRHRKRTTWAEELYRLGLVFVREGVHAGRLFFRLGELLTEDERYGEAIGHLRRAQVLGVEEREVFPVLGRAFLRRQKIVPAAALLETAVARGADSRDLTEDLAQIRQELERAGVDWNVPVCDSEPPEPK
ncbi:MAG: hypothetical protein JRF63_01485 [Deltaproteobacteria bacterium]|nr:hypothetical protein [Deltaproteobacteria bacterium]